MIRILVTGGSGFIGTNLIEDLLLDSQNEVMNIDIKEPKLSNRNDIWRKVDICDYDALHSVISDFEPEIIIHLAARTDLNGITLEDYSANNVGVENLIESIQTTSSVKRVLIASSMYVCEPGYSPKNDLDFKPHTVYGESKVQTEEIVRAAKEFDVEWCFFRPTSIWGPFFGEPYDKFFRIVLSGMYFHMGKRACKKTYGYIDNTVCQLKGLMNAANEQIQGKVFYLGDYEPYPISEWADEIADLDNRRILRIPYFIFQCGGWFGDLLKSIGITFPMTSFRLKNMTTDNVHNMEPIRAIVPLLPGTRKEGTKKTIDWIRNSGNS